MGASVGLVVMPGERRSPVLELIESCGVQVLLACGVAEARKLLGARPVDIVFTDTTLPDGDWRDVVALRSEAGLKCEVIVWAQRLETRLCSDAFAHGVWEVVSAESLPKEELRRTIEAAISRTYMQSLTRTAGMAGAAS